MKKKVLSVVAVLVLTAVLAVALMACMPTDYKKAHKNLKEAGYEVESTEDSTMLKLSAASLKLAYDVDVDLTAQVLATKKDGDTRASITVYYCASKEQAKLLVEKAKAFRDEAVKEIENEHAKGEMTDAEYKEALAETKEIVFKAEGKIAYFGHKTAVKDAK